MTGVHDTIGRDLVNHCVNDILVQGAEPLFFLDYLATGRLSPDVAEQIVDGHGARRAARTAARCSAARRRRCRASTPTASTTWPASSSAPSSARGSSTARRCVPGDVLLGLPSVGPAHQRLLAGPPHRVRPRSVCRSTAIVAELGETVGEALLRPHRSYLRGDAAAARRRALVKGMAHITGGGLTDNLPRILPARHRRARCDSASWPVPPLFRGSRAPGGVTQADQYRAFNMGIGLVVVAAAIDADALVVAALRQAGGRRCTTSASIVAGDPRRPLCLTARAAGAGAASACSCPAAARTCRRSSTPSATAGSTPPSPSSSPTCPTRRRSRRRAAAGIETLVAPAPRLGRAARPTTSSSSTALHARERGRRVPRRLHAASERPVPRAIPGPVLNVHPSLLPSFPGVDAPAPGARARRQGGRLHRAPRDAGTRCRADRAAGGRAGAPGRHARVAGGTHPRRGAPAPSRRRGAACWPAAGASTAGASSRPDRQSRVVDRSVSTATSGGQLIRTGTTTVPTPRLT